MITTIVNYVNFYYGRMAPPKTPLQEYELKIALVYKFLYEHYVRDYISLETILHRLPPFNDPPVSRILRNHLIFFRAFKYFRKHYKAGRWGHFFPPLNPPFELDKLEVYQYLTGIIYWIFNRGIASPPMTPLLEN